jgi:bis(5'-nucleosidyl)-tetraphosphatase
MPKEKSCGVVVFREVFGRRYYLLLHYEEGHWDFPKGHVEEGESEIATALRELEEETGIKDAALVLFRERIEYFYTRKGKKMHKEVYFFLARTVVSEVELSDEHIGFEWLAYDEALGRLTYQNAKDVLMKAEKALRA